MSNLAQSLEQTDNPYDLLFNEARTYNNWQDKPVSKETLKAIYDLTKMGPTSANCCPLRITFVTADEGRERLKPFLAEGNVDKTMSAPAVAILAMDMEFYEELPFLFPHTDARSWFVGDEKNIYDTAFRNSTLQAGYFILAARSMGLDCGPMSGFDAEGLDKEFFPEGRFKSNFLCNLGYGDAEGMFDRSPRFDFDKVCTII